MTLRVGHDIVHWTVNALQIQFTNLLPGVSLVQVQTPAVIERDTGVTELRHSTIDVQRVAPVMCGKGFTNVNY